MKNKSNTTKSAQSIKDLTVPELEKLVETIVERRIKTETKTLFTQTNLEESFWETFGAWEDEQNDEEIIQQIYDSRYPKIK